MTLRRFLAGAISSGLMIALSGGPVRAEDTDHDGAASRRQEALQHFQQQQWEAAVDAYRVLTAANPDDGEAWYRLGYALHAEQMLDEAIVAHRRAGEIEGPFKPTAIYNLGCAYALQGKTDEAFEALNRAVAAGMSNAEFLKTDTDLASIRSDSRYAALLDRMNTGTPGPFRQFDFWLGEWNVLDSSGRQVGTNSITRQENGFVIFEQWTSAAGGTGRSMSFYDPAIGKWRQVWVAASGGSTMMVGEFRDGAMHFDGEPVRPDGTKLASRMTMTPNADGTVRQYIERSTDGGKTWNLYFDGTYVRKSSSSDGT